eukprot:gene17132-biopygen6819
MDFPAPLPHENRTCSLLCAPCGKFSIKRKAGSFCLAAKQRIPGHGPCKITFAGGAWSQDARAWAPRSRPSHSSGVWRVVSPTLGVPAV